jgi:CRISPR-associated protein Cas1
MRRLLNTLYVSTQGSYLRKEGDTVVVEVEKEVRLRLPLLNLGGIVCFGSVLCSPFLLGACAEAGVSVSFLTEYGRFLANVSGAPSGNVLLRREQYRRADDLVASLAVGRSIIAGKIANTRHLLRRSARENAADETAVSAAADRLGFCLRAVPDARDLDHLRGIEGEAAQHYFGVFDALVVQQKEAFAFTGRNRHPPEDNINALLSFLYTLLMRDVAGALTAHGLDPAVGFFHRDRPGRASLALDLMEEFRASFADRLALALINRQQIKDTHFERHDGGAVLLNETGRKEVLTAYQKRKQEEIHHPFLDETLAIGIVFHAQALLLARHLRGDLDAYPPFEWR